MGKVASQFTAPQLGWFTTKCSAEHGGWCGILESDRLVLRDSEDICVHASLQAHVVIADTLA